MTFDLKELNKFIFNANINGYAFSGENREKILPNSGKEIEYKDGDFYMKDIYFGSKSFIGEEIIFYKKIPIWGMNYYGTIIAEPIPMEEIYGFLKNALCKTKKSVPFRGPDYFIKNNFNYFNKVIGRINKFSGQEKILYKNELVYILNYSGGFIFV